MLPEKLSFERLLMWEKHDNAACVIIDIQIASLKGSSVPRLPLGFCQDFLVIHAWPRLV